MKITPVENKSFGAIVTGANIGALRDAEFAAIEAALLDRGFLVFSELSPTDGDTIAFAKNFGELEFAVVPFLSNQDANADGTPGVVYDINSQRMRMILGNETWHTDSTYKPYSSKCAMLSAVVVPEQGGGTGLADMRAGYAALDQATKDRIADLAAYHSNLYSQANDLGDFPAVQEGTIYHGEAYLRPLVKVHPQTGVKNLFIGRHAFGIPGLSREESRALLKSLLDFVVADEARVYEHNYRPGDLLVWDNRALLHRALPYDYTQPRTVIGTRVAGKTANSLTTPRTLKPPPVGRRWPRSLRCYAAKPRTGDTRRRWPQTALPRSKPRYGRCNLKALQINRQARIAGTKGSKSRVMRKRS